MISLSGMVEALTLCCEPAGTDQRNNRLVAVARIYYSFLIFSRRTEPFDEEDAFVRGFHLLNGSVNTS